MFGWNVVPTPTNADWLAARHRLLTASDVSKVMGLSRYGNRESVLKAKLSPPVEVSSRAMRAGQFQEPAILAWFLDEQQRENPDQVILGEACRGAEGCSVLVAHSDATLCLGASPDGFLARQPGRRELVEVKCTGPNGWAEWDQPEPPRVKTAWDALGLGFPPPSEGCCPLRHWVQLQTQLLVTGEQLGWVVGACGTSMREHCFRAMPAFHRAIEDAARKFKADVDAAKKDLTVGV